MDPPSQNSSRKGANANFEGRVNKIKELLFQPGGPTHRQEALSEAAVQTCQCVEEFAPARVKTFLIIKSTTLCVRIRNAYSELNGKDLLAELELIVVAIVTLLYQELMEALS